MWPFSNDLGMGSVPLHLRKRWWTKLRRRVVDIGVKGRRSKWISHWMFVKRLLVSHYENGSGLYNFCERGLSLSLFVDGTLVCNARMNSNHGIRKAQEAFEALSVVLAPHAKGGTFEGAPFALLGHSMGCQLMAEVGWENMGKLELQHLKKHQETSRNTSSNIRHRHCW